MARQLIGSGTFPGEGLCYCCCCQLLLWLLLPSAPSFVKITQVDVLGLCPVPAAHTSSLMSEAWVDAFRFVLFFT